MTDRDPHDLPETANHRRTVLLVCVLLVAAVLLVFGRTVHNGFVNFDDDDYFYGNPHVEGGLTWPNAAWAFQAGYAANWHPLTWLSLMLDVTCFGTGPTGPHLTNLILHAAGVVLLFLLLQRLTGCLWPSAFVAAAFGVHPLHVESVAWVSERKDVLSGVFFMLTLMTYLRYARPTTAPGSGKRIFYGLSLVFFALGLMSKPMLVTVPFVLLLLDYWPLQRLASVSPGRLVLEKLPFFILSGVSCVLTMLAQRAAISSIAALPAKLRIGNAFISYATYLVQMFYPANLAAFYPYPDNDRFYAEAGLSLLLLAGITAGAFALRKRRPYLWFGWLWYVGMLVPAIGLVQVGGQAHADRYTYLPLIGVFIMLAWAARDFSLTWRHGPAVMRVAALGAIAALMTCAFNQATVWRNSETLWTHTLGCTSRNYVAENDYGNALYQQGRVAAAITHFKASLAIYPRYVPAHNNLGIALAGEGRYADAIAHYRTALEIRPGSAEVRINLGNALVAAGQGDEAIGQFQQAVQLNPGFAQAYNGWGAVLLTRGHSAAAAERFQQAVAKDPFYAEAWNNLGSALAAQGQIGEAVGDFQKAIQFKPVYGKAHYNLADLFAAQGRVDEAIEQYRQAVALMPDFNHARYQLGVLLQGRGRFSAAIACFQEILKRDPKHVPAQNDLAWILATCPDASLRNGPAAIALVRQAIQLSGRNHPELLDTLAAADAEAGDFDGAVATATDAVSLARARGNQALAGEIQNRLELYEGKRPFRDAVAPAR